MLWLLKQQMEFRSTVNHIFRQVLRYSCVHCPSLDVETGLRWPAQVRKEAVAEGIRGEQLMKGWLPDWQKKLLHF